MYNVKFLFLAISLIHQLTTPKVQRRMSEGLAKDNPPQTLRYTEAVQKVFKRTTAAYPPLLKGGRGDVNNQLVTKIFYLLISLF